MELYTMKQAFEMLDLNDCLIFRNKDGLLLTKGIFFYHVVEDSCKCKLSTSFFSKQFDKFGIWELYREKKEND